MFLKNSYKVLTVSALACTGLWATQATARGNVATAPASTAQKQMEQKMQDLQQQVLDLKDTVEAQQKANNSDAAAPQAEKNSDKSLTIGGGVVTEYQVKDSDTVGRRAGGDLILDYLDINIAGDNGDGITYAADYRWSDVNFADGQYLHYGWAAYDFGQDGSHQIQGGMFQVPFGNLPYGYDSFWGSLGFYMGLTDNQAAGLGYKYEAGPWRLDVDAFKNDDLEQTSTYGGNPFDGYDRTNGGNMRLAYTFNNDGDNPVNVSAAVRGGQLEVNDPNGGDDNGNHVAGTIAINANLGLWTVQGQAVDYKYNVPKNTNLPRDSIRFQDYGFGYLVPASGQLYSVSIARRFPVEIGPISEFKVYNDYGYLKVGGDGTYADPSSPTGKTGDTQDSTFGISMVAGPVYIWADMIIAKNGGMVFNGPNDGDWHQRFNLTAAYYFGGDLF